jgi:protein-L-isoaspartate(D-aspartate) O-methyltransferase
MGDELDFAVQREEMVRRYRRAGYIRTEVMAEAMLRVPREEFMKDGLSRYSYFDQPFQIPGDGNQTISAPYMYPISYEYLKLKKGDRILEVGAGSGYGAALAYELVGEKGLVVAVEINQVTFEFAKKNLCNTGYNEVVLVLSDGSVGYPEKAPYNAISVTASMPSIPSPLIEQLSSPGRLVAPVGRDNFFGQDLTLLKKDDKGKINTTSLMKVAYVPLKGKYGWR